MKESSKVKSDADGTITFSAWLDIYKQMMENWGQTTSAYLKGNAQFYQELAAFSRGRLEANAEFVKSLCGCRDANEAVNVQRAFFDAATKDYSREGEKLTAQLSSLMKDTPYKWPSATLH